MSYRREEQEVIFLRGLIKMIHENFNRDGFNWQECVLLPCQFFQPIGIQVKRSPTSLCAGECTLWRHLHSFIAEHVAAAPETAKQKVGTFYLSKVEDKSDTEKRNLR